jgi:hypothetical protein
MLDFSKKEDNARRKKGEVERRTLRQLGGRIANYKRGSTNVECRILSAELNLGIS